jgi:hypothetical protein
MLPYITLTPNRIVNLVLTPSRILLALYSQEHHRQWLQLTRK